MQERHSAHINRFLIAVSLLLCVAYAKHTTGERCYCYVALRQQIPYSLYFDSVVNVFVVVYRAHGKFGFIDMHYGYKYVLEEVIHLYE